MNEELEEGWTLIFLGRNYTKKWHYVRDHRSLCGKYMVLGHPEYEQGNDNSPDNYLVCRRNMKMKKLSKVQQEVVNALKKRLHHDKKIVVPENTEEVKKE